MLLFNVLTAQVLSLVDFPILSQPNPNSQLAWRDSIAVASATHVGMRRRNNQDSFAVVLAEDETAWRKSGHLLIVADGMGAHAAGELASRLSVELIPHHYGKLLKGIPSEALQRSLIDTNSEIFRRGQANPEFRSMGTTTCALAILPEGAVVAHVGDSRVYRLRGSLMEQLTFDHSLVWEMRASGDISEEALRSNAIPKNVITRSLGPNPTVAVDLEGPFPLRAGDKFLICSDGLSGQLTDEEIGVLLQVLDIHTAVQAMIHLANLRGGPDNVTVVVAEIVGDRLICDPATREKNPSAVEPVFPISFGITTVVCGLVGIALLLLGQLPIAIIAAAAAIAAFGTGWFKYQSQRVRNDFEGLYGRGPYRKATCKPDLEFTSQLTEVIHELGDWVRENDWKIGSKEIDDHMRSALTAENAKNYAEAIRHYIQVISITMEEVRKAQDEKSSDSDVDL
ncbi:MAG: protein phosphatase 2C domain-containing protein [Pirellula sp.]